MWNVVGNDQLFNLLAGRKIQERYNRSRRIFLVNKMLLGTDGRKSPRAGEID